MTIRNALILAGLMLALALGLAWANNAGHLSEETSRRASQVLAGLVVVYFANLVPKSLEPLLAGCEPSRAQAMQRFGGWTLVIGGLGYSVAWLVAPLEVAKPAAIAILATALVLVVGRCAWTVMTRRRERPPA